MSERTFSIIKPDAVRKGHTAAILAEIEKAGFKILGIKKIAISKSQAEGFYAVHSARPFFDSLTTFHVFRLNRPSRPRERQRHR